jgi:hypothetical protein
MELSDLLVGGQKLSIGAVALVGVGYLLHLVSGVPNSYQLRQWVRDNLAEIGLALQASCFLPLPSSSALLPP